MLSNFYDWGIVIRSSNTLIGTITVVEQADRIKMLEIGYVIGKAWWGKGYLPEALEKIVNYLFHSTDVRRIEAKCDIRNQQSKKVLEKCGFTFEGVLRQRSY
ncbi:GNAT family N-acetyltransferase [Leuconostoc miyukkimchii]|uniref:GNAT family N-acetyltransferase n=1 Tax=Leuconostoc miyukkimchii TaxID=910540 RepID=UPI002484922B|nr:GNAT family N-acetyltransferase [Leuconostoc miyukkimchii]